MAINYIFKYSGIKEIYNELVYRSQSKFAEDDATKKETTVIALYSGIGGSGKTSLGMGLGNSLVQQHKRVLYISTESMQSFAYYLKDKTGLSGEGYHAIKDDLNGIYPNIRPFIRNDGIAYIPPFTATLDARNLSFDIYHNLVQTAKKSKDYDFIIVDVEAGYDRERMALLQMADKVIVVVKQDAMSLEKTSYLLNNLDISDKEKYLFVCNQYDETKDKHTLHRFCEQYIQMNEYIECSTEPVEKMSQISELKGIQKLAYMFI